MRYCMNDVLCMLSNIALSARSRVCVVSCMRILTGGWSPVLRDVTTYCPLLCLFQPVTVTAMRANVASIWKFTAYRGPRVAGCALNVDIRPQVAIVNTVQRATIGTLLNPSRTIRLAKVGTAFSFLLSLSVSFSSLFMFVFRFSLPV